MVQSVYLEWEVFSASARTCSGQIAWSFAAKPRSFDLPPEPRPPGPCAGPPSLPPSAPLADPPRRPFLTVKSSGTAGRQYNPKKQELKGCDQSELWEFRFGECGALRTSSDVCSLLGSTTRPTLSGSARNRAPLFRALQKKERAL